MVDVSLRLSGTEVRTQHHDRDEVVGRGAIDLLHDQTILVGEARLSVDLGLPGAFTGWLSLPLRAVRTRIDYLDPTGAPVMLVSPDIHHRDETVWGISDPILGVGRGLRRGRLWLGGRLGLSLPIGRTEEDPFAAGELGMRHQHVQLGTGTFDPTLSVDASFRVRPRWGVSGFGWTQQILYENAKRYQAGDRYAAGAYLDLRGMSGRRWSARLGGELSAESRERWSGAIVASGEGNTGRLDLMAMLGGEVEVGGGVALGGAVRVPFYSRVSDGQIEVPVLVELVVRARLGGSGDGAAGEAEEEHHDHDGHEHGDAGHEEEDGHGHEEEDEHEHEHEGQVQGDAGAKVTAVADWTGLDVVTIGEPGSAPPLSPVSGKITVFDFWAPWCKPCKRLDLLMAALMRRHPELALRKLDVVDWDSAAAATYLTPGNFPLPHLKVFDAAGHLVLERSGSPEQLIRDLEAILAAAR